MKKLNLPNKLTVLRLAMVPVFVAVMYFIPSELWMLRNLLGAGIFLLTSITDAMDGHIARKYNLITDFGKFLDPLADKFIVISAMTMIFYLPLYSSIRPIFVWVFIAVLLREFAVTGLRLIISNKGTVLAAGLLGKIKTVLQMVFILAALLEPVLYRLFGVLPNSGHWLNMLPLTMVSMTGVLVFTLWSGIDYFRGGGKYIDPEK